ncbi:acyltransferase [Mammaliicoccus lentus]|uniref:acyltransferase n=1 Tax=Mammaliicoccus lentus TaxID=42858 RepID=UPI003CF1E089
MKYYGEIPIIRSFAAMLVVLVHVSANIYYNNGDFTNDLIGYINQIGRLGIPVFAVISAFLLTSSVLNRGFDLSYFIKSRFTKILVPYLIWSIFYLFYRYFYLNNLSEDINIFTYFMRGNAQFHLYFILTVIQFYIFFPFIHRIKKGAPLIITVIISGLINYWWINKGNTSIENEFVNNFINNKGFILNWIYFFVIGIAYSKYYNEVQELIVKYKNILFVFIAILSLDLFISVDLQNIYTSLHSFNIIYIPFFLILINYVYHYLIADRLIISILTLIGNYSMGIYLVHILVIDVLKRMKIFENVANPTMFIPMFLSTILGSMFIVYLISKLPYGNYIVPIPKRKQSNKASNLASKNMEPNI